MKAPNLMTILHWNLSFTIITLAIGLGFCFPSNVRAQQSAQTSSGHPELALQVGHRSFIYRVAVSPDGKTAASVSQDGTLKIWDALTGDLLDTFAFPSARDIGFQSDKMAFSADGRTIIFLKSFPGGAEVAFFQYKITTREFRDFSNNPTHSLCPKETEMVAVSPGGEKSVCKKTISSGGLTSSVEFFLWDNQTGQKTAIIKDNPWFADSQYFQFSPDGGSLAIFPGNGLDGVVFWNIASNRVIRRFGNRTFLEFSADGRTILLIKRTGTDAAATLELWDKQLATLKQTLTGNLPDFLPPIYSPDGRLMALATESNLSDRIDSAEIILYDLLAGKIIGRLPSGKISSDKIAFSQDGASLTALNWRGVARIWDTRTGELRSTLQLEKHRPKEVAFNGDGQIIVTGGHDGGVAIWNFRTGQIIRTVVFPQHVAHPSFFADDRTIIHAEPELPAMVWDLQNLQASIYAQEGSGKKSENAYKVRSPNGNMIVRLNSDGKSATLSETQTGKTLGTLGGHTGAITAVIFAPDGINVATVSGLPALNVSSKALLAFAAVFKGDKKGEIDAEVGKLTGDRTIRIWDARTGLIKHPLQCDGAIHEARILPDGSAIVATHSGKARTEEMLAGPNSYTLWDVQTGKAIKTVLAEGDGSYRLSSDGSLVIFSGREKLQALDVRTGALKWETSELEISPLGNPFSPDGQYLLVGTKYMSPSTATKLLDLQTGRTRWAFPDNGLTSFSPDGRTVVCYDANKASFLDLETGRLKWSIGHPVTYNLESPLLPGGSLAATFGRHYAIELRDLKDGRLLVSLLILPGVGRPDDKGEITPEWIAFTPEGYYTASPGAARYIRWRVGDKLRPAEAHSGEFNRPDLVQKAVLIR